MNVEQYEKRRGMHFRRASTDRIRLNKWVQATGKRLSLQLYYISKKTHTWLSCISIIIMHIYIIYIYIHMWYMYLFIHIFIGGMTYTNIYIYIIIYILAFGMNIDIYIHTHIYIYIYICIYMCTHVIHVYTYIYIYTPMANSFVARAAAWSFPFHWGRRKWSHRRPSGCFQPAKSHGVMVSSGGFMAKYPTN